MRLAKLYSRAIQGMYAPEVCVEVHIANGLPDIEARESRDRVRSAIQIAVLAFPASRITVNLAPANLPIELGILLASGLIQAKLDIRKFEFAGELALDGQLRKLNGVLAIAYNAQKNIVVGMPYLNPQELENLPQGYPSVIIRKRVIKAQKVQLDRQNSKIEQFCKLENNAHDLIHQIISKFGLSTRSYYRLLKVARTIADLDNCEIINKAHIAKSAQFKKRF